METLNTQILNIVNIQAQSFLYQRKDADRVFELLKQNTEFTNELLFIPKYSTFEVAHLKFYDITFIDFYFDNFKHTLKVTITDGVEQIKTHSETNLTEYPSSVLRKKYENRNRHEIMDKLSVLFDD